MKPPRGFLRWLGPWRIAKFEGLEYGAVAWVRDYQEESHCGADGCCELRLIHFGPVLTEWVGDR